MIEIRNRARSHADRAGDPLDGLVNLFDLGISLVRDRLYGQDLSDLEFVANRLTAP